MSRRVSALVAFVVAIVVSIMVFALGRAGQVAPVYAIVTTQTIPQDTPIAASWVKQVVIPKTAVVPGMVESLDQVVGRYASYAMTDGQYVQSADVEGVPLRDGLCVGQVGYAIAISSPSQAVGIYPGMYVNVVRANAGNTAPTTETLPGQGGTETGLIAAGVRVVSVENSSGGIISGPTYANQDTQVSGVSISANETPAMVELAIPADEQSTFASAVADGGVSMSPAPWLAPKKVTGVCTSGTTATSTSATPGQGAPGTGASGTVASGVVNGAPTSPGAGTATRTPVVNLPPTTGGGLPGGSPHSNTSGTVGSSPGGGAAGAKTPATGGTSG